MPYDHKSVENKWQKRWEKEGIFVAIDKVNPAKKKYILDMFPYPSGAGLHVGHPEGYTATDIYSRYLRMRGYQVLHPMGWDAFGLPAENYAIKSGIHPKESTENNIKIFTRQIKSLGFSYDWTRAVNTASPDYYKWTQWLFLQLYKNGLAYKKAAPVNWCPDCQTVLANEQVVDGQCERCGTAVVQKNLEQWFFKITGESSEFRVSNFETTTKKTVLMIHGLGGHSQENWFPWLKRELENRGYEVLVPDLPNTNEPTLGEWLEALKEYASKLNHDSVIIGNSLGGPAALQFVAKNKLSIAKLILVAPPHGDMDWAGVEVGFKDEPKALAAAKKFSKEKIAWKTVQKLASRIVFYFSEDDPYIPITTKDKFAEALDAEYRVFKDKGHFNKKSGITEFPEILKHFPTIGGLSYPERLLNNLESLDWPEPIKTMQRNWIGRSKGLEEYWQVEGLDLKLSTFTTWPHTTYGATFIVIAPEHPVIDQLIAGTGHEAGAKEFIKKVQQQKVADRTNANKAKEGYFTGRSAINHLTGWQMPIYIANFAVMDYGTGIVKCCPAHDERDWEFAKKYNLPIKQVIEPLYVQTTEPGIFRDGEPVVEREALITIIKHWSEEKYIGLQWKKVDWRTFLTGGIEPGQTIAEAGVAEVREETGYLHPKFIKELGVTHGLFYHVPKQENRLVHGHIVYFELEDEARAPISDEENERHEIKWLTVEELKQWLTPATHQYALTLWQAGIPAYVGRGIMKDAGKFTGLDDLKAKEAIADYIVEQGNGQRVTNYKLRDWLISRQRYWGAPMPIIYCRKCSEISNNQFPITKIEGEQYAMIPVPEDDLPVTLPDDVDFRPTGESPLMRSKTFHEVKCPKCGKSARRESDTMDTFVDSSWYFLRYTDPKNKKEFAAKDKIKAWLPVDTYVGGAEHAVMHLMYARFITMVLHDLGYLDFEEPFLKLRNQGLILGPDGQKMSKSRGNVINPDEVIEKFGADTMRMYEMFMGPLEDAKPWDTNGIVGVRRFLDRVFNSFELRVSSYEKEESKNSVSRELHRLIKKVGSDIESFDFNTAVSQFMIFVNTVNKAGEISKEHFEMFLKVLSPLAPHLANELWEKLGHKDLIEKEAWPEYDESLLVEETVTYVVQVNGKVRAQVTAAPEATEKEVAALARAEEKVGKYLEGKKIMKQVFVKGKLVNFVVK